MPSIKSPVKRPKKRPVKRPVKRPAKRRTERREKYVGRIKNQKRKEYSKETIRSAVDAVRNGCSIFGAAKTFNVPRSTLFYKVSGKIDVDKKSGPNTILSVKEEGVVVKWIFELALRGFPVGKNQLLRSVQLYLNHNKRETCFKGNLPGRKWYNGFRRRHPLISEKISQNLTASRAAISEVKIKNWHAEVQKYCEDHNLLQVLNDPSRVFNMDEKGFVLTPNKEVVLVKRGEKAVYNRSKNDEKECVTALLGGSAAGVATPPMMIHAFQRMPAAILQSNPAKWSIGISDSGWQTQDTFFNYITEIFYPFLLEENVQLPVILYLDGHKSHVSVTLSEFCSSNKIELIALYPNSTHLTQPMDVGVFKPLNSSFVKEAKLWRLKEEFAKIQRKDVAPILEKAIDAIKYSQLLVTAFQKSGLYPFNVHNVDFSRLLPEVGRPDDSQDQLWNETSEVPNSTEITPVSHLKHFESLIGTIVLELFRTSDIIWTGEREYTALFKIWQQMYRDALSSTVNENTIAQMDDSSCVPVVPVNEKILYDGIFCMGEDGEDVNIEEVTTNKDTEVNTQIESEQDYSLQSINEVHIEEMIIEDAGEFYSQVQSYGDKSFIEMDDDLIFTVEANEENILRSVTDVQHEDISIEDSSVSESQSRTDTKPSGNQFSPDAFEKAFFWPSTQDRSSKKNKPPKEKLPTVMTSEQWRDIQSRKIEEKDLAEKAKEERKVARAIKKLQMEKLAQEKKELREAKKAAAKDIADEKLKKRLERLRMRSEKVSNKSK